MINLTVSEFRNKIADIINTVGIRGDRVMLSRNGKDIAAMIPIEDLRMLEALENKLDVLLAKEALDEHAGDDFIPWEEIRVRYGLK